MAITEANKTNVLFKIGEQKKYNELSSKNEGTFYVTSDTHRLYLGDNLLSQSVQIVSSLPTIEAGKAEYYAGTIYYLNGSNILAVYDSNKKEWTQLNPDNYFKLSKAELSFADKAGEAGTVLLDVNLEQTNQAGNKITPDITSNALAIKGATGVAVSTEDNALIITGTTYELKKEAAAVDGTKKAGMAIKLKGTGTGTEEAGTVYIRGGENTTVSAEGVIDAVDTITGVSKLSIDTAENTNGFSITVETEDAAKNNHKEQTKSLDPIITLGDHKGTADQIHFVDGIANLPVYTKQEIDDIEIKLNAMHYIGLATWDSTNSIVKYDGKTIANSAFHIGDSFKVETNISKGSAGNLNNEDLLVNDLLIANGTEYTLEEEAADTTHTIVAGTIKPNTLTFDRIPGGVAEGNALTYKGAVDAQGKTVELQLQQVVGTSTSGSDVGGISITAGTSLEVANVNKTNNDRDISFTLNHSAPVAAATDTKVEGSTADVTAGDDATTATGKDFTAITSITYDATGHITGASTKKVTIKDTVLDGKDEYGTSDAQLATGGKSVTFGGQILAKDKAGKTSGGSIANTIKSESLTLSVDTNKAIGLELTWGIF